MSLCWCPVVIKLLACSLFALYVSNRARNFNQQKSPERLMARASVLVIEVLRNRSSRSARNSRMVSTIAHHWQAVSNSSDVATRKKSFRVLQLSHDSQHKHRAGIFCRFSRCELVILFERCEVRKRVHKCVVSFSLVVFIVQLLSVILSTLIRAKIVNTKRERFETFGLSIEPHEQTTEQIRAEHARRGEDQDGNDGAEPVAASVVCQRALRRARR